MKNVIQSPEAFLEKLSLEFDQFPASTQESTMLYNYNKLMNILQGKELKTCCNGSPETISEVFRLSEQYGVLANNIVRGIDMDNIMTRYYNVEQAIEQAFSRNLYIYAKQWGLSVKALYYHKIKNYEKAFDFSIECITLNDYLIREGMHTLLYRSAEQNKNLSRVLFRSGDWKGGALMARDLLNYLFNGKAGGLYGSVFKDEKYWNTIPYVREGYAYECFRVMVSQMIRLESQSEEKVNLFPHIFGDLEFEVDNRDRQIIYNWIYLKKAYQAEAYEEFLEEFISFMSDPMSQLYDALKISLFMDINELIEKSDYSEKSELLFKIKNHLDKKLNIYEHLRKDVSTNNFPTSDLTS